MIILADYITIQANKYTHSMRFGEKIAKLKKEQRLSQIELANLTGISRDAISKYERGDVLPSIEYANRIAIALGVSLDYLVSDDDKQDDLNVEAVKRVKEIQSLPDAEKDKVFSVVDALIRDYKTKQAYK